MTSRVVLVLALFVAAAAASSSRVVGGSPAGIDQYPFVVQVESQGVFTGVWSQTCAGCILNSRYVLSVAQCFSGILYAPQYRRIRAGSTYRNTGGVLSSVETAINHPTYGQLGYDSDISVVRLADPLVYTPVVQQAIIAAANTNLIDNLPVVHVGWGVTQEGGDPSSVLLETSVFTISREVCSERYLALQDPGLVTENMFCAGLLDVGGRGACQGDFGGPVIYTDVVVGIASWGHGCGDGAYPGVSTAVWQYTNWILDTAV